jgi:hypothetical protein
MTSKMSSRASRGTLHHCCKTFTIYTFFETTVFPPSNVYITLGATQIRPILTVSIFYEKRGGIRVLNFCRGGKRREAP